MTRFLTIGFAACAALLALARDVSADSVAPIASPENNQPRVGGHLGVAVPLFTVSTDTTTIGKDFVTMGVAPGITVRLSEKVAIDYEFVAYTTVDRRGSRTALVVDPGVVYDLGPVVVGLRAAVRISDYSNFGLIPIVNKGFKIGNVAWFVELDLPVFFNERAPTLSPTGVPSGDASTRTAFTAQLQTGVGF